VKARKRFGQHFLEPVWARKLVASIDPQPDDVFLEIGPGRGALTLPLSESGATIRAIEIDRDVAGTLAANVPASVTIVRANFLSLSAQELFGRANRVRIVGNLPYNLSSPILVRLLDLARETSVLRDATIMLQREVADRVRAQPGSGDYGPLAIAVQLRANVDQLLSLPPGAFRPPPRVHSTVIRLTFHPPSIALADPVLFNRLVRTIFQQRRKTVASALRALGIAMGFDASRALARAGLDPRRRPETFTLEELSALTASVSALRKDASRQNQPRGSTP
jgi:16S rRNA (adenine1518-N6/adenine1519-N6)-dimethyltransferase